MTELDHAEGIIRDYLTFAKPAPEKFEPYFTTKGSKGTGLGMMVVFRIVESMNGKIKIASKPGMGTSITLQFPLAANEK